MGNHYNDKFLRFLSGNYADYVKTLLGRFMKVYDSDEGLRFIASDVKSLDKLVRKDHRGKLRSKGAID